jgi:hypothetical protein
MCASFFSSRFVRNRFWSDHRSEITVAARSEAWTVFARSNAGVVGSNPTQGMNVCLRLFCVCVALCVGRGLATGWSLVQGDLPIVWNRLRNWRRGQGPTKGYRAIDDEWVSEWMNTLHFPVRLHGVVPNLAQGQGQLCFLYDIRIQMGERTKLTRPKFKWKFL